MWDPRERVRKYLLWTAILIIFLLVSGIAIGKTTEKVCDTIMYGNCYKDGKLVATKKHECVDCDLNKEVWQSEVADIDKVETILDKIEKIENDKSVYYDKVTTIEPKKVDGQYCFIKVIIKETDNQIIKEEILECADGRKKVDGPSYWELFAQFYYRDVYTPEYCRYYSRHKHVFKTPGKVCLTINGEWEVR